RLRHQRRSRVRGRRCLIRRAVRRRRGVGGREGGVRDQPRAPGRRAHRMTLKAVDRPPADEEKDRPQPEPEPPAVRMPVDIRSAALTVLAVLAAILVLQYSQAMVIPIVLGLLISYALEPVVARLTRWRVPRPVAAAIVLLGVTAASGRLAYGLRSEATEIVDQLPTAARRLRRMIENERPTPAVAIQQVQKAASELEKAASAAAPPPSSTGIPRVQVEATPFNVTDYV